MRLRINEEAQLWPERAPGRPALRTLLRSLLVSTAVIVGYFVLPFTSDLTADTVVVLVVGTLLVAVLLVWQIRGIVVSPYPRARAVGALTLTVTLFFVVFALTYYLMGEADASNWSEPLTRLDAMYFTVTVFATVGFGDISAVSETARAVVTGQMVGDLLIVGLFARLVVRAMQEGLARRDSPPN